MGVFRTLFLLGTFSAVGVVLVLKYISIPPPPPEVKDYWWGRGKIGQDNPKIRPLTINVSEEVLTDLKARLDKPHRFTEPLEGIGFQYGFNTDYLKKVIRFWREEYDWRAEEKRLNQWPHFKTQIQGLDIHFIHAKPDRQLVDRKQLRVLPLLMLHGWPGSIIEFYKILPLLTSPREGRDFVFEVICPSLPGFGFSEAAHKPGMGAFEMAILMTKLMDRLGFEKYYLQGGDWGSIITTNLAKVFPQKVLGLHLNMAIVNTPVTVLKILVGSVWPRLVMDPKDAHKIYPLFEVARVIMEENGYLHLQATKPDTIGVALTDSPAGLAAYLLEKVSICLKKSNINLWDGGITEKLNLTELLTNVMVYWVTGSAATAARLYSETFNLRQHSLGLDRIPCTVPTGYASFPNEVLVYPEALMRDVYPQLMSYTDQPRGGHFAALEEPQLLADDIWTVVGKIDDKKGVERVKEKK